MADVVRRGMLAGGAAMAGAALMPGGAAAGEAFGFRFTAIEGGDMPLSAWRGRPMLVVNTASFCGYTPQYAGLQRLHARFAPRGLVVLGVPSNDFDQESGDAATIKAFCDAQFGVEFPMTTPEHVRGPQAHPFFAWLASRAGGPPRWNFHKYLVARDGSGVTAFPTRVEPDAPPLLRAIEQALG